MVEPALISVVIPTRDRAFCLPRAVGSVLAQRGAAFELIVVDDGSADSSADYLGPLAAAKEIRLITHPAPKGVSAARNAGIAAAKGDLVAFLDSDDEWLPGKLAAQRRLMDERRDLAASQCLERWIRGGRRVNPGLRHQKRVEGDFFAASLELCLVSPSAAVVRRRVFERVGLFDESLPACEDYDLWLRILAADLEIGLLEEELVVRHGGRPDQLSARPGLDRYRIRALKGLLARARLSPARREMVLAELGKRRNVYEAGRRKRAASGQGDPEF